MSAGKIGVLVLYAALAVVVTTMAGSRPAEIAQWVILALVIAHLVEVVIFFRLAQRAEGSLAGNLFQVLLFGVLHAKEMKAAPAEAPPP